MHISVYPLLPLLQPQFHKMSHHRSMRNIGLIASQFLTQVNRIVFFVPGRFYVLHFPPLYLNHKNSCLYYLFPTHRW